MRRTIAIFGESMEGPSKTLLLLRTLPNIVETIGHPTETGLGVHMAIQAMLFGSQVLFYRIQEEGFQSEEYAFGCKLLEKHPRKEDLAAIALPGVGDSTILALAQKITAPLNALLLLTEKDLYDFTTQR